MPRPLQQGLAAGTTLPRNAEAVRDAIGSEHRTDLFPQVPCMWALPGRRTKLGALRLTNPAGAQRRYTTASVRPSPPPIFTSDFQTQARLVRAPQAMPEFPHGTWANGTF